MSDVDRPIGIVTFQAYGMRCSSRGFDSYRGANVMVLVSLLEIDQSRITRPRTGCRVEKSLVSWEPRKLKPRELKPRKLVRPLPVGRSLVD